MFAGIIGDSLWNAFWFVVICTSIIRWRLSKIDPEGKVKTAAKHGMVRLITRWMK